MYRRFIRESPALIINYLQYVDKININPWTYTSYKIHQGTLEYIVVIDFIHNAFYNSPFIIDLNDYFNYYRKMKINKLKTKI